MAWLGIVIGEPQVRGQGIGRRAVQHLESLARNASAHRAEIGVFAFNEVAMLLYQKLGYKEFGRTPSFTWWDGRLWDDVSMEKNLQD